MSESEDKKSALGSVTDAADATKLATIESGQLASARARLGLSLLDLAAETRIPKRHLTALENHQVDRLPAKLFVIGYLRTCADRLGLNLDDLLAEYGVAETVVRDATANATNADTVLAGDTAHSVLSHGPGMAARPTVWRIAAFAIVPLLFIVFLAWIYSMQDDVVAKPIDSEVLLNIQTAPLGQLASVAVNQQAREPKVAAKAKIDVSTPLDTDAEKVEAVVVAGATGIAEAPPAAIITINTAANTVANTDTNLSADTRVIDATRSSQNQSQDRLVISVKEDSWVHITDSAGSQLFRDLARAGKKIDVMGDLPFDVHLGNAPGLALELNGSPFAITDYRDDNSARLVLGSR